MVCKVFPSPYHRPKYHQNHSGATWTATEHLVPDRDEAQLPDRPVSQKVSDVSNVRQQLKILRKTNRMIL